MSAPFSINFPAPPLHETRVTRPGEEFNVQRPEQAANLDEQRAREAKDVAETDEQRRHKEAIATAEAQIAADQGAEQERQIQERAAHAQAAETSVNAWRNRLEGSYKAALAAPTPSLFGGDKSTAEKVMTGLALSLGGISDAVNARVAAQQGRSPGISTVNELIATNIGRQKDAIEKLKDNVVMARTGLQDAQEARKLMLAEVDARGAAIYKRLETAGRARLVALKVDQAGIDQHAAISEIQKEGIKYRGQAVSGLYDKFQKPTVENVTRDDSNNANKANKITSPEQAGRYAIYGQQIKDDLETLSRSKPVPPEFLEQFQRNTLATEAADASAKGGLVGNVAVSAGRAVGLVPKSPYEGIPAEHQRALNGYNSMVTTMTHFFTGAGMPFQEAQQKAVLYSPVPGDTPTAAAEKLARAEAIANQMLAVAGPEATATVGAHARRATGAPIVRGPSAKNPIGVRGEPDATNPDDANGPGASAPLTEHPEAPDLGDMQKGKGALPVAAPGQKSRRDQALELLRETPRALRGGPKIKRVMERHHITEADLGQ